MTSDKQMNLHLEQNKSFYICAEINIIKARVLLFVLHARNEFNLLSGCPKVAKKKNV